MEDGPAQAATTDLPVKEIPELLEWFNEKLATTLFPMLAARYPEKVKNATDLRAHDSHHVQIVLDALLPFLPNLLHRLRHPHERRVSMFPWEVEPTIPLCTTIRW